MTACGWVPGYWGDYPNQKPKWQRTPRWMFWKPKWRRIVSMRISALRAGLWVPDYEYADDAKRFLLPD